MNEIRAWLVVGVVLMAAMSALAAATGGVRLRHHPAGCSSCAQRRALAEASAPAPEMKAMRIELIKQQILKKLRLKEPPVAVAPRSAELHKPLAVTSAFAASGDIARRQMHHKADDQDGYFAKTDHVILFPYQGDQVSCPDLRQNELEVESREIPTTCFPFLLPNEIQAEDLTSADLWLYRRSERTFDSDESSAQTAHGDNSSASAAVNMTLSVAELVNWDLNKSFQRLERLGRIRITPAGGWVKLNLLNAVKEWVRFQKNAHVLMMTCQGCDPSVPFLGSDGPFKPFLVIKTHTPTKSRRPRRNVRCTPGMEECCREDLYINFSEIGWGDWIIMPPGYQANFCRGSCRVVESLPSDHTAHSSMLRRAIMHLRNSTDLVQCCAPTKLDPLEVVYMADNQTMITKHLSQMSVDTCGCM